MNYKFKTKPYAHQLTALEKSWNRETYAYFMEMGTGKTKVLIDNVAMLYDKGKVNGALIVAPKGVIGTWYNQEIPTHMPDLESTGAFNITLYITLFPLKPIGCVSFYFPRIHVLHESYQEDQSTSFHSRQNYNF